MLRRQLIRGLAAAASLGGLIPQSWAAGSEPPQELRGTEFDLVIAPTPVNITGVQRVATAVNGMVPGPVLHWREGDTVTLRVTNRLSVPTSIHWHGILLPAGMDGVPGLSFPGIAPGETFVYSFPVKQSGTYWYHSHSGFQEQSGLYGAIVIEPKAGERVHADREHVVLLSDWTDSEPAGLFRKLKQMSDFFNFNQPTAGDFFRDVAAMGFGAAVDKRKMWNQMRMMPTDFGDVTAAPQSGKRFTYLMNGQVADRNWTALFRPGEKVRLRVINGSATSIFDVRIPGLKLTVIAADGQDVKPVAVDEFRISVAEVYDVLVEPTEGRAYTLFAQSIDRSGYARGTLAPRAGMQAEVPAVDKVQWLTMKDMMGAMMGSMAGMASMAGMGDMKGMEPAKGMGDMKGMDHGKGMGEMKMDGMKSPPKVRHAVTEYGPDVDMHVDMPRTNLDDPGPNLRDNGRRVLTYADLHTIGGPLDARMPTRDIELHLTGHMERFVWSFDGQKYSESKPVHFRFGERLRIVLVNDTMMNHPIHLHGMWGELESPDGEFQVRKHTINVQPAQRVAYRVTADAKGRWAYHCHLLYHMEAGMFREVLVS
ncbi:MAG: copper resistance system multicopper oxidase [Pseudomonadota bacterium]|nr:copper resistance system multicopper oxidase [Pseudomonadota bacterium]